MKDKEKVEKVTIELPKPIMDFLRVFYEKPETYLKRAILCGVKADLDSGETFVEDLSKKHGLTPFLENC